MCFFFMPRRCKFAKPLAKLRKNEGTLFFILFEGTSKKTAKKFARFQKTFYLCTRIQNKCIIASVAQLVRAPDC